MQENLKFAEFKPKKRKQDKKVIKEEKKNLI